VAWVNDWKLSKMTDLDSSSLLRSLAYLPVILGKECSWLDSPILKDYSSTSGSQVRGPISANMGMP